MSQTISDAVAQREQTPAGVIATYAADFARVLPSHIKPETWVRVAQGAHKRGRRDASGLYELEIAARNNMGVFLATMLDAARLGLEPGTEYYYLTPRKVKGRLEILGIVGYQGYVDLMYRSGAVASVVVEVVRENDAYQYRRGIDRTPVHEYPSFAREAARGPLIGTYAYAELLTASDRNAASKVVELNVDDIDRIKAMSQGADGEHSPWVKWEASMWLKSAARQLRKWVPTSTEYRREIIRATAEVMNVSQQHGLPVVTEDVIEGEVEVDDAEWPPAAQPGGAS